MQMTPPEGNALHPTLVATAAYIAIMKSRQKWHMALV